MNDLPPSPFDDHYGLEADEATDELLRAHVAVRQELLQPVGLVHGGVHASIAEALLKVGDTRPGAIHSRAPPIDTRDHTRHRGKPRPPAARTLSRRVLDHKETPT